MENNKTPSLGDILSQFVGNGGVQQMQDLLYRGGPPQMTSGPYAPPPGGPQYQNAQEMRPVPMPMPNMQPPIPPVPMPQAPVPEMRMAPMPTQIDLQEQRRRGSMRAPQPGGQGLFSNEDAMQLLRKYGG